MRYVWLTVMAAAVLGACRSEGITPSTRTDGVRKAEAAVSSEDQRIATARRHVTDFRTKLADRGVHPDRFEKWVATLPSEVQIEAVRSFAGELPQFWGAVPGTLEARLLAESRMTDQEKENHRRSKGPK